MFAEDFVGLADTGLDLQSLIDSVHNYSRRWRFEANIRKCAVVIFQNQREFLVSAWVWGHESLPNLV